ncbi:MAG: glycosyltransferase family 2 protein [Chitinophagaceae bacterium]|nr:glycosyltransferase family 2 protein [Chitinophagaceae bacterium]
MKLSICVITYNHEDYIVESLESVLSQVTSFDKEIIIGEDFSTDRTREICMQYAEKYPDLIRLIPAEKNVGMMANFLRTFQACKGEYVAFIEGDDFWTDPLKLQKQVDFLQANPDYSACFHNVILKYQRADLRKEKIMHANGLPKDSFDTEDVLGPWFIASPSFVFVNYPDLNLPDWFFNCKYGDLPLMLLLTLRGKFKYLDEVMGVYRLHDKGMSLKHIGYDKIILMIYIYESFNIHTNYKFQKKIREAMVYEIDRHIPKDLANGDKSIPKKATILERGYNKIRRIISQPAS